ncbi:MAG: transcription-repair coupling factor [Acidobacteria bacterium]|nr:MAG: transcription-repair coupling factor [Acidobacteriota bacterium]
MWIAELLGHDVVRRLARAAGGGPRVHAASLSRTARLLALVEAVRSRRGPTLLVAADDAGARSLTRALEGLLDPVRGDPAPVRLPALEADPYRGIPSHPAVAAQRVAALDALAWGASVVIVVPVAAFLTPVPGREEIRKWGGQIARGGRVDLPRLAREVVEAGYRVADVVVAPGDFARRGGLFDIWPPQEEAPVRVELLGDIVESLRRFDPATQRTTGRIDRVRWLPAREAPIAPDQAERLLDRLVGRAREVLAEAPATREGLPRLVDQLLAGVEGAPALYREDLVPLHRLAEEALLAVWEPEETLARLRSTWEDLEAAHRESAEGGDAVPPPRRLFVPPEAVASRLETAQVTIGELPCPASGREPLDLRARPPVRFEGRLDALEEELRRRTGEGRPVILAARNRGRRMRLQEILEGAGLAAREVDREGPWSPEPGELLLADLRLDEGVEFAGGATLLAEPDLFGADPPAPPPRRRRGGGAFVSDLRDLKPGDRVVHVDHGVGRYAGLERHPGSGEEMLVLEYAGGDRLYVPVSRLDLIQKYSGGDHALVPLDRLGGTGWERRRRHVRRAVQEMAKDLLDLYARRMTVRARPFRGGTRWQEEFEQAFPHELTPDQRAAWEEIRRDLASERAMDRLLCGDVGYGKTEVALRAAFQVVQEGYQVAVLVPTTVLAVQHLATFRARMAAWPVRIEALSRLTSTAEARRIIADTAEGRVDILIGTHRLLSGDVRFKRLGLLIVDEEQRFGVRQKEKIKRLSLGVHVLAMSATPIPRTLQMSLAGVRDLSVIETPPRNRHAIQTLVSPWSPTLAAAAIRNELRRGGQVFFVHPRVEGIERVASRLEELVPEAVIRCAHGRMGERELERTMLSFVRGETQVLVATTIIENGLDIPRANTILIDQAHRFGLAQLYQMRGRVGRSDRRAYAYLFVPARRELTPEARRRLAALVEFTELGAGFRIAALDLEIRGAGELLGARQSGHIAAVGFEMYVQMLEAEVRRLKGEPQPPAPEPVTVNLGVPAYLPEDYIPDSGQRLAVYKRLSVAESEREIEELRKEVEDRFGRCPQPVIDLFRVAQLRLEAARQGAVSIDWSRDGVAVRFGSRPRIDTRRLVQLLQRDRSLGITPGGAVTFRPPAQAPDRLEAARMALEKLAS